MNKMCWDRGKQSISVVEVDLVRHTSVLWSILGTSGLLAPAPLILSLPRLCSVPVFTEETKGSSSSES